MPPALAPFKRIRDQDFSSDPWLLTGKPGSADWFIQHEDEAQKAFVKYFVEVHWNSTRLGLGHLRAAIDRSRAVLELPDDFDDEGSPAYTEEVWRRAVTFLEQNAEWVRSCFDRLIEAPEILPGPEGSIDIHWDYPSYELLVNIPADPEGMAGFYGDDRGKISIKGTFDPKTFNHGLLLWLAGPR